MVQVNSVFYFCVLRKGWPLCVPQLWEMFPGDAVPCGLPFALLLCDAVFFRAFFLSVAPLRKIYGSDLSALSKLSIFTEEKLFLVQHFLMLIYHSQSACPLRNQNCNALWRNTPRAHGANLSNLRELALPTRFFLVLDNEWEALIGGFKQYL